MYVRVLLQHIIPDYMDKGTVDFITEGKVEDCKKLLGHIAFKAIKAKARIVDSVVKAENCSRQIEINERVAILSSAEVDNIISKLHSVMKDYEDMGHIRHPALGECMAILLEKPPQGFIESK